MHASSLQSKEANLKFLKLSPKNEVDDATKYQKNSKNREFLGERERRE